MIENAAPYINEWRISKYPSPDSKKKEVSLVFGMFPFCLEKQKRQSF